MGIEGMALSKEARALGFPIVHKHKLSCLRQELIDAFVESRYMMFIKYAAVQLQQLGLRKQMDLFGKDKQSPAIEDKGKEESSATNQSTEDGCNKEAEGKNKMEEEEAKKIVESITDSITSG